MSRPIDWQDWVVMTACALALTALFLIHSGFNMTALYVFIGIFLYFAICLLVARVVGFHSEPNPPVMPPPTNLNTLTISGPYRKNQRGWIRSAWLD